MRFYGRAMLSHLPPARALPQLALAAALAAMLMSGCGGDDDAAQSKSASSSAAAVPASERPDRNCPVAVSEVSRQLGLELRAIRPKGSTKVSCSFRPKADCPCGPTKYSAVDIDVTAGMADSVTKQRDDYLIGKGLPRASGDPFTDRPDLGKDAFMIKPPGTRGRYATFPSSDGPALVNATFGIQDAANREWVAQDTEAAERIIALVVKRMS
jgi:hypothetical protein